MYYWTCPRCGANLDTGERCDCVEGGVSEAEAVPHRQETAHRTAAIRHSSYRSTGMAAGNHYIR